VELYLHSPLTSDSKDHILLQAVARLTEWSLLRNCCCEFFNKLYRATSEYHQLWQGTSQFHYLTIVSLFYNSGMKVHLRPRNFKHKRKAFILRSKRADDLYGCMENGLYLCIDNSGTVALWLFACRVCCCWVYKGT